MAQIQITTIVTITDEKSQPKRMVTRKTITGLTAIEERDYAINSNSTRTIWDPTNVDTEVMTDFDFLFAWSDGNVFLENVADIGADNGAESGVIKVVKDLPYMLGSDDSFANYTAGAGTAGTADVIDKLIVNEAAGSARKLKVIMAT